MKTINGCFFAVSRRNMAKAGLRPGLSAGIDLEVSQPQKSGGLLFLSKSSPIANFFLDT
jgi:hypothetical protein